MFVTPVTTMHTLNYNNVYPQDNYRSRNLLEELSESDVSTEFTLPELLEILHTTLFSQSELESICVNTIPYIETVYDITLYGII